MHKLGFAGETGGLKGILDKNIVKVESGTHAYDYIDIVCITLLVVFVENGLEEAAGVGFGDGDNVFGTAFGDDATATVAAFGAKIDDPVGGFDDVHVVFDQKDAAAVLDEALEAGEELADVVEVEARRGFVEDEEGFGAGGLGEVRGEFDALGFAT